VQKLIDYMRDTAHLTGPLKATDQQSELSLAS